VVAKNYINKPTGTMAGIGVALKTVFVATDESAATSRGNDHGGLAKCYRLSALAVDVAGTLTTNAVNVLFGIPMANAATKEEARKPRTFFTKHKMETIHFRAGVLAFNTDRRGLLRYIMG
jgi:hypothetical protein